jgi:toxin ParE1/3/4
MSARSRRHLTIEERDRLDIEDALTYTQERWGKEQRRRYRAQITQATRSLLDYPERGRPHDEYYLGCRSLLVEHHIIYYRLDGDEVVVGRVLHSSQDPTGKVTR